MRYNKRPITKLWWFKSTSPMRVESRCSRPPLTASFTLHFTSLHFTSRTFQSPESNINLPSNSSRNLSRRQPVKLIITFNQENTKHQSRNSTFIFTMAFTRWQRKMDNCGKYNTVTTEENANGKNLQCADISIQMQRFL